MDFSFTVFILPHKKFSAASWVDGVTFYLENLSRCCKTYKPSALLPKVKTNTILQKQLPGAKFSTLS